MKINYNNIISKIDKEKEEETDKKFYPLLNAIKENNLNKVITIIESGVDVTLSGNWAIMLAASKNNLEIVKCLVQHGADLDKAIRIAKGNFKEDLITAFK